MRICVQAYAKINWSLDVLARRDDGYHELNMLMQRIELADELTFERAKWLSFAVDGSLLPVGSRNLVLKAANALMEFMGKRYGARISLKKNIPVRAGLGGGSTDCAATLLGLNRLWDLRLPLITLKEIGSKLGADVPYCMTGGFARVNGIGEKLDAFARAERFHLVLVNVRKGLSTLQVFSEYDRMALPKLGFDLDALAQAILDRDFEGMKAHSGNALEAPAIALMPEIGRTMRALESLGAGMVRMTGSGSTVFGVFPTEALALAAAENLPGALVCSTLVD